MSLKRACNACGRPGGEEAGGTKVNIIGCTGACRRWALGLFETIMEDFGRPYTEVDLELPDAVCESVVLIFSGLNVYGWAMLKGGGCGNLCPYASITVSFLELLAQSNRKMSDGSRATWRTHEMLSSLLEELEQQCTLSLTSNVAMISEREMLVTTLVMS